MVVQEGGAVSYERGNPVAAALLTSHFTLEQVAAVHGVRWHAAWGQTIVNAHSIYGTLLRYLQGGDYVIVRGVPPVWVILRVETLWRKKQQCYPPQISSLNPESGGSGARGEVGRRVGADRRTPLQLPRAPGAQLAREVAGNCPVYRVTSLIRKRTRPIGPPCGPGGGESEH